MSSITICTEERELALHICATQRRIFIFGAQGYFKSGALLEGLRRLISYKLALHVQVFPIHKHITLF